MTPFSSVARGLQYRIVHLIIRAFKHNGCPVWTNYLNIQRLHTMPTKRIHWLAKVATNICGSPLWTRLHVTLLKPRILWWLQDFFGEYMQPFFRTLRKVGIGSSVIWIAIRSLNTLTWVYSDFFRSLNVNGLFFFCLSFSILRHTNVPPFHRKHYNN